MSNEYLKTGDLVPKPPEPRSEEEIMAGWKEDWDKPLVSILCITYNHAPYIADALNGFLTQETDFPFEIIVHDDASTDETRSIVEDYKSRYPNLIRTILQTENQYSKGNRPVQFFKNKCSGKYSALCEGDDYWLSSDKLSKQVLLLEKNRDVLLSIHPAYFYDVNNEKIFPHFERRAKSGDIIPVSEAVSASSQFAPTASYLFRTEEFYSMPDWFFQAKDLPFSDYFIESILGRHGILYVSELFSVYRRNVPGSYTQRTTESSDDFLISRISSVLIYTSKLEVYKEISTTAIHKRKINIVKDYQRMAVDRRSLYLYRGVSLQSEKHSVRDLISDKIAMQSEVGFQCYRLFSVTLSKIKRGIWALINRFARWPDF